MLILVVLTIQGWFGDTTNLFVIPANGLAVANGNSFQAFFATVTSHGFILMWHSMEGILLILLAIIVTVFSFMWSKKTSVRVVTILGLFFVLSAAYGGYSFAFSGFTDAAKSAQMGGRFIGAYAFYFIELYFTK